MGRFKFILAVLPYPSAPAPCSGFFLDFFAFKCGVSGTYQPCTCDSTCNGIVGAYLLLFGIHNNSLIQIRTLTCIHSHTHTRIQIHTHMYSLAHAHTLSLSHTQNKYATQLTTYILSLTCTYSLTLPCMQMSTHSHVSHAFPRSYYSRVIIHIPSLTLAPTCALTPSHSYLHSHSH